jgi:hypothetical protein
LYRSIIDFKKSYLPRSNILIYVVKDVKDDLVTDSHSALAGWRKQFSQLLNVHGVNDVRKIEICPAGPLVPEPSAFEAKMTIEKLKRQNHQKLIKPQQNWLRQGVGQFALRSVNLFSLFGMRRNCLRSGRSRLLYLFIGRVIVVI